MSKPHLFKWRHFLPAIIIRCVRWYCRYSLSYREVEELTQERGLRVDHSTVFRWVQAYAPQLDKRCRRPLRPSSDSWRVDEVYVKVKGDGCIERLTSTEIPWTFSSQLSGMLLLQNGSSVNPQR